MAMEILLQELEQRVKAGIGATEKGAPRVMIEVGHTSDPRVTRMIEDVGLAVPLTFILSWVGGPPVETKKTYTTPGEMVANYELAAGFFHGTDAMIKRLEMGVEVMKLDGFIKNYPYNCRPGALPSHISKEYLEEKTGLPVLSLEVDIYDSRAYSAASMRTKVETFAEMLKTKKASATG
jgi:benzoyl-CoA reductase/2-hydroxyglutaryl-CoA dehydratase subunit BcrC/BadD/HgdB